jgi:hypothetical protein
MLRKQCDVCKSRVRLEQTGPANIVGPPIDEDGGTCPKSGIRHCLRQRAAQRQLIYRELVEVYIGNTQVRGLSIQT